MTRGPIVGVLALQGAFYEHIKLLRNASFELISDADVEWEFIEVRTPLELAKCDALIIPGGESTSVSLVAERSNLLEPLREFVKYVCACPTMCIVNGKLTDKQFFPYLQSRPKAGLGNLCWTNFTGGIRQSDQEGRTAADWWT